MNAPLLSTGWAPWVRRGRRFVVVPLVVGLSLLAVRAVGDIWTGQRWRAEVAQLETRYGPLQYDSARKLDAWKKWPTRLAADNRARILDGAAARVTVTEANDRFLHPPNTPASMTFEQRREVSEANREAIALAVGAASLQHSNWDIVYVGEALGVPNLADHMYLGRVLAIAARYDADAGRSDDAAATVRAMFAEAGAFGREPLHVMLVGWQSKIHEAATALKDLLDRAEPSGASLERLSATIGENVLASPANEALLGDLKHRRAMWPWVMQGWLWGRRTVDYAVPQEPATWMRVVAWAGRPVIRVMAMRDLAEAAQALDVARQPSPGRQAGLSALPQRAAATIRSADLASLTVGRAAVAVALRRYRLDHGQYPERLSDLVPAYLPSLPMDPFSGGLPDYERHGAGFVLKPTAPWPEMSGWLVSR